MASGFDLAAWTASDHDKQSSSSSINHRSSSGSQTNNKSSLHPPDCHSSLYNNNSGILYNDTSNVKSSNSQIYTDNVSSGNIGHISNRIVKDGDWRCESCQNINFAKRTRCNKCGLIRPKDSDALACDTRALGGPPGLFKKGDWACAHCGNVNWARRDRCNICNACKPIEKEEPRTGRAGGHFDLQDPSDRNNHDSDDEDFDEFGRRKKKQRTSSNLLYNSPPRHSVELSVPIGSDIHTGEDADGERIKLVFPPAPTDIYSDDSSSSSSPSPHRESDCRSPSDSQDGRQPIDREEEEEEEGGRLKREFSDRGDQYQHHHPDDKHKNHKNRNQQRERLTEAQQLVEPRINSNKYSEKDHEVYRSKKSSEGEGGGR